MHYPLFVESAGGHGSLCAGRGVGCCRAGKGAGAESFFLQGSFTELEKYQHIEEMHTSENEDDGAYFQAQGLHQFPDCTDIIRDAEGVYGIPDIHQVETYQQEVIDGLRQFPVAVKNIDEKDLAVAEERACYPDGQYEREGEIEAVTDKNVRHNDQFLGL